MVVLHLIVVINTLDMVLLLHLLLHTVVTKLILEVSTVVTKLILEASTVAMVLLLHHHLLLHTVVLLLILEPNTIQAMKLMMKTTVTLTTIATMTMAVAEAVAVAEAAAARAVLHAAKMEKCIAVAKVLLPVIIANKSIVPVAQVPGVVNGVALSSVTMKRIRMHQNVILKEAIVAVEQSLINVIMECG